jgi:hypothetical protein
MSPASCRFLFLCHISDLTSAYSSLHIRGIRSPRCLKRKEAHPELDEPFDARDDLAGAAIEHGG